MENLEVTLFEYQDFIAQKPETIKQLRKALFEKGIAGLKFVPGFREIVAKFIEEAKRFSSLPEEVKQSYAPNRLTGEFTGYEIGAEQFQREDGQWVTDDSKASYYAIFPESDNNRWPSECDLQPAYMQMSSLMFKTSKQVMQSIGLVGEDSEVKSEELSGVSRMLHYRKLSDDTMENPLWCGAHFDHGLFTALLPAFYFVDGKQVVEPEEAGLFVRTNDDGVFHKVVANDPDVMLFQVGEFGQLVTNDEIMATEHRVHKALGKVDRYTMAFFINPGMNTSITSHSILTKDSRYGSGPSCNYQEWNDASLARYLVKKD